MTDIRIVSFAQHAGPLEEFLALPAAVEGLNHEGAATAEAAGVRALLDPSNSYYASGSSMNFLAYRDGEPAGRLTAFCSGQPDGGQADYGLLGNFACFNDVEVTRELVEAAGAWLRGNGRSMLRGPMAGDIWHRWRFMTRGFETEPFAGEPRQPEYYPALFTAAGFSPVRTYSTKQVKNMEAQLELLARPAAFNQQRGISYRNLDRGDWLAELKTMYELCRHSFASNWGVSETTEQEFVSLYDRWLKRCGPEHIIYALDKAGAVVGLGLALVRPADTINLKTIAVLPGQAGFGLGKALAAEIYQRALAAGQTKAQHCLMDPESPVQRWDHGLGQVTREYAMFERSI